VKFLENFEKSGVKAIQLLLENGAETLLMSHMGERPFQIALQSGIEVFYVGKDRVTISEAVEKFQNGDFQNAKEVEVSTFNSH
jgi:predicted Fe-Mo cluster-binding NifX family protein